MCALESNFIIKNSSLLLEPAFTVTEPDERPEADGAHELSRLNVRDTPSTDATKPVAASVDSEGRFLEWRVVHFSYPRETQEQSYIGIKWFLWKGIKLPKFFIQKRTLEKLGAAVNHDLLCQQIEAFLNSDEMKGYDLFSISSTYSGHAPATPTPKHPYQQLMMARSPNISSRTKEVLVIILKRK